IYTIALDPPGHPHSGEPFGVDLVCTTRSPHGLEQEQRLTLAEYPSFMSAEEHLREAEMRLFEQGREGLEPAMTLVQSMPYEPDNAVYIVGVYPFEPDTNRGTLSLLRLDGERLEVAPLARGPVAELIPIDRRLSEVKAEGDTARLLDAVTHEATRSGELAPGTPLFAVEGQDISLSRTGVTPAREDHPDWPDRSAWDQPPTPRPAALVLPVTFGEDMTPFDAEGRYVPHHHDEANTVHFFSVIDRPSDSPLPEDVSHELRYFRAHATEENIIMHDSQPVMPVADPDRSPWPLPALNLYLEDGDLAAAQTLARDTAGDHDLPFPDQPPPLGPDERQLASESGWYHFDAALVSATPQGVDDGYSVGVVDVYANHENGQWAARHLPMGEFDTLDGALSYQQQTLLTRVTEDRESAFSPAGFNDSPAIYERIALAEADAALTDLLEQNDGHYPPDYEGDHEPIWEPLTSKEWDAYRDHVRVITENVYDTGHIHDNLPTATPHLADDALISASIQPDAPYLQALDFVFESFEPQEVAPTWRLDVVPAFDPDGAQLGYSAVCVVDFADLAEAVSPDAPQRAQWLEVAQFQTEERAQQFHEDFMSLSGMEELSHITGPAFAKAVADDLGMNSQWQTMDEPSLEQLKAGEWRVTHPEAEWQPRLNEASNPGFEATNLDIDL
ncbi:MAG: hypothetical protein GX573_17695, partial [Chloroflexi bacterium]|nr:hypothetical protein [Chloroflexota bacterium]